MHMYAAHVLHATSNSSPPLSWRVVIEKTCLGTALIRTDKCMRDVMMMEVSLFYISNLGCLDDELALLFEVAVGVIRH